MLRDYIRLLRPKHWIKNIFVLAGLVFGKQLLEGHSLLLALQGFVCFCGLSSVAYVLNDLRDRETDRHHPTKNKRPLAAGSISAGRAVVVAIILAVGCLAWSLRLDGRFAAIGLVYLVLNMAYTIWLKDQPIVDVIAISLGFVLRAVAGVVLLEVELE